MVPYALTATCNTVDGATTTQITAVVNVAVNHWPASHHLHCTWIAAEKDQPTYWTANRWGAPGRPVQTLVEAPVLTIEAKRWADGSPSYVPLGWHCCVPLGWHLALERARDMLEFMLAEVFGCQVVCTMPCTSYSSMWLHVTSHMMCCPQGQEALPAAYQSHPPARCCSVPQPQW